MADSYIREKHLKTGDYKYIKFERDILGYKNCEMILLGGYDRKVDWGKIEQYCYSHNIKRIWR